MYNIVEEDAVGTLREHLVHMDLLAGTMCGIMDTSDWPNVLKRNLDQGLGFNYHKTLKCRECAQNEPLNKPPPHKWLRDGGPHNPFIRAVWLRNLQSSGVDTSTPEYVRLTPNEILRITKEVRTGAFRRPEAQVSPNIQNMPFLSASPARAAPLGITWASAPINNSEIAPAQRTPEPAPPPAWPNIEEQAVAQLQADVEAISRRAQASAAMRRAAYEVENFFWSAPGVPSNRR